MGDYETEAESAAHPHAAFNLSIINRIVPSPSSDEARFALCARIVGLRKAAQDQTAGRKFSAREGGCYAGRAVEKKGNVPPTEAVPVNVPETNAAQGPSFGEGQGGQNGPSARTRRTDTRRGVSEKITVCALKDGSSGAVVTTGWALNMSRSGIRAILEDRILAGVDYEVTIGEVGTSQLTRKARVVWVQEEHDGVVVGLEFLSPTSTGEIPAALLTTDAELAKENDTVIDVAPDHHSDDDSGDDTDDKTSP